jgi:hypothetical protein
LEQFADDRVSDRGGRTVSAFAVDRLHRRGGPLPPGGTGQPGEPAQPRAVRAPAAGAEVAAGVLHGDEYATRLGEPAGDGAGGAERVTLHG